MAIITSAEHDHCMTHVQHQPRVAWDGARAFVRAATRHNFAEFSRRVRDRLGPDVQEQLIATRDYLIASGIWDDGDRYPMDVEAGKWRWRLQDLLQARPDLAGAIVDLTAESFEL